MSKLIILPNNQLSNGCMIKIDKNHIDKSICNILMLNNIFIPNACGMFGKCTTCKVIIKEGINFVNKPEYEEFEIMNNKFDSNYRLSCQLYLKLNHNIILCL